jgi:hypothetical protein
MSVRQATDDGSALAFNSFAPQQALIRRAGKNVAVSRPSDRGLENRNGCQCNPGGVNGILQRLSGKSLALIEPHLRKVKLAQGVILHEAGEAITTVYFR